MEKELQRLGLFQTEDGYVADLVTGVKLLKVENNQLYLISKNSYTTEELKFLQWLKDQLLPKRTLLHKVIERLEEAHAYQH